MKKGISFFIILIFLIGMVNATVLVNTEVNKESIGMNEVAIMKIKLLNNEMNIENYPIRIETGENLVLLENEQTIAVREVDLEKDIEKVIEIRFKAINTDEETGKLFVYHGDKLQFVSGTYIETKPLPVIFNTSVEKRILEDGEKIFVHFEAHNYSQKPIYNLGIEIIVPENFISNKEQEIIPILMDNNSLEREFVISPPLEAEGDRKIIVAHGYFDDEGAHYFEESHVISFEKNNNLLLAGIGIIVLIIAVFIYMSKGQEKLEVKGTAEKAEEEK
jgi:hypothetical protein